MTQNKPRVGLLPLYLKLYDDSMPKCRAGFLPFLRSVCDGLARRGLEVVESPICRVREEFHNALARYERDDVVLIVALHLAYSPSLEAIDGLATTSLPILLLDTTMDASFGPDVDPGRIMYNHGIHGVMDLASVLRRRKKTFWIMAGHIEESDVLDRAADVARAAYAARCLHCTRALRIGEAFDGMGDFSVDERILRLLGVGVRQVDVHALELETEKVTDGDTRQEMSLDQERFVCELPEEVHARSVRAGLGLRRMLDEGGYTAFSMNFLAFDRDSGPVRTVPFLEASKAMARGTGYSGEGDVLTAALVGSLLQGFGKTTFTEIFCPDWLGDSLFLSHMGETNPAVAAGKPRLVEKPFPFTNALNPAVAVCAPRPGPALFVNLAPGPGNSFGLIAAQVEVLPDATNGEMCKLVRGWIRPASGVSTFLEAYSRHGGTHHSALLLDARMEAVAAFAQFSNIGFCEI